MCGLLAACFNGGCGGLVSVSISIQLPAPAPFRAHFIPALSSPLLSTRKQSTAPHTRRLLSSSPRFLANSVSPGCTCILSLSSLSSPPSWKGKYWLAGFTFYSPCSVSLPLSPHLLFFFCLPVIFGCNIRKHFFWKKVATLYYKLTYARRDH